MNTILLSLLGQDRKELKLPLEMRYTDQFLVLFTHITPLIMTPTIMIEIITHSILDLKKGLIRMYQYMEVMLRLLEFQILMKLLKQQHLDLFILKIKNQMVLKLVYYTKMLF